MEGCADDQKQFEFVNGTAVIVTEAQTPYFEQSFQIEKDCETDLSKFKNHHFRFFKNEFNF